MNKKGITLIIGLVVIVTLFFVRGADKTPIVIEDESASIGKIKVVHTFVDGIHSFNGEINLPTPCHILQNKIEIKGSQPEQVTIAFETKSDVDTCVQMVISEPFLVSFEASKEAEVQITLNDKNVPFEIIEMDLQNIMATSTDFLPTEESGTSTDEDTSGEDNGEDNEFLE